MTKAYTPEQIEELLYQLHDIRQRLSLAQQELVVARSDLKTLVEDPEQGWIAPADLRKELDEAYSRIGALESELKRARADARAETERRHEQWSWAGPEIEKLKHENADLTRKLKDMWEWCQSSKTSSIEPE